MGAALVVALIAPAGVEALETDQYYTWGRPLLDATAVLNAKLNLEIAQTLAAAETHHPGRPPTCEAIARDLRGRLHFAILQPIEVWATHSSLVPRLPATSEEELTYRRTNLNGNHGPFDTGRWIPDSPTVEVNGVRLGTDKLSHFFSSGWRYRQKYLAAKKRGLSDNQAQETAVRWGVLEERSTNGLLTDGVFSFGDLEANFGGMRFYLSLCEGSDPLLALDGNRWIPRRPFDWREYVTPAWDESYHVSIYSASRWRKVQPRLVEYCSRRHAPDAVERLTLYRAAYTPSLTDEVVAQMIRDDALPDPSRFTLDANCPTLPASASVPLSPPQPPQQPATSEARSEATELARALMGAIREHERNQEHRVYTIAAARVTSSEGLAASVGWLFTRVESDFDCHTICDLRGPTVQLEPGLDGGQLSVGYARIFGETGRGERFLATQYVGLGARGTLLHTWSDGYLGPSGLTFAGLQGQFTITRVSFTLGVLWHVGGGGASHDRAITWGFGWGF